jgi:isopenicillin-N N-acyltransferase-like protein
VTPIEAITVPGRSPSERGAQLGATRRDELRESLGIYESLFATYGLAEPRVRSMAERARRLLEDWAPDLSAEVDALAEAAGVERWRLHAVNARTEILAAGGVLRRGECSTVAVTTGRTVSAQTWDWHRELSHGWQVVKHVGGPLAFVTLTERGVLGKIGVNAAGVGLHFNILGHASDATVDGVPVHAVARRVLDTATDAAEAEQLIRSAPLQASSCFTVMDATGGICVEASPAGVAAVPSSGGTLVHTNHFLDEALASGDLRVVPEPDTVDRLSLLRKRAAAFRVGVGRDELVEALWAHDVADGAPVCCHAAASAHLGDGWETLATVVIEPARRHMDVLRRGPCQAPRSWGSFTA